MTINNRDACTNVSVFAFHLAYKFLRCVFQFLHNCIASMTQYNLMCHSATHQLIRLDMGYTVNCSAACANNCVNTSQANCSVSCCNSTGCLNDTFVSMMIGPSTGEQMRESFLISHCIFFCHNTQQVVLLVFIIILFFY